MTFCSRSKLLFSGATMGVLLMLVAPPPTSAASWGCLGQGVTNGGVTGLSFSFAELIQVDTDNKGNVLSGTKFFNFDGEACSFPITGGSFTIGSSGVGTVSLNLTIPAQDLDSDFSCWRPFFRDLDPSDTSLTENYNVVMANGGKQISFSNADDFLSGAAPVPLGADGGDIVALTGQCLRQ